MIKKINCLGDFCPIPAIKAKMEYKNMDIGDKIMVISDHSCAPTNIADLMAEYDCTVDITEAMPGIYEIIIERLA